MTTTILDGSQTRSLIGKIMKRGLNLDRDIHVAAMSSVYHATLHGDITLANKLIAAMPKSGRRNALVSWMLGNTTGFALNTDKATKAAAPLVVVKGDERTFAFEQADGKPFWDFKATEGVEFSYDGYLATLTKGIEKTMGKDGLSVDQKARLARALAALTA